MKYNPSLHHRRSIRWKGHDYKEARPYFVTICTQGRCCLFGEIVPDGGLSSLLSSAAGKSVGMAWMQLQDRFPDVAVDEWILMPNHLHGIVILPSDSAWSLFDVVHDFKAWTTTLYCHGVHQGLFPPFEKRLWHRNYFERVIRDDKELENARNYIVSNPVRWLEDKLNPVHPL